MTTLKPKKATIYLTYQCQKCGCEWDRTIREARYVFNMICGGCGSLLEFKPIETAKVKLRYKNLSSRPTVAKVVKPAKSVLTKAQEDAILAMKSLGFPVKQSKEFVSQHKFQSVEDYIQAAIREGTR